VFHFLPPDRSSTTSYKRDFFEISVNRANATHQTEFANKAMIFSFISDYLVEIRTSHSSIALFITIILAEKYDEFNYLTN
jgi:hypothetical protein